MLVYSSSPWRLPSRPKPDCFTPPKGAAVVEMMPAGVEARRGVGGGRGGRLTRDRLRGTRAQASRTPTAPRALPATHPCSRRPCRPPARPPHATSSPGHCEGGGGMAGGRRGSEMGNVMSAVPRTQSNRDAHSIASCALDARCWRHAHAPRVEVASQPNVCGVGQAHHVRLAGEALQRRLQTQGEGQGRRWNGGGRHTRW
jgi:hypothetical protein